MQLSIVLFTLLLLLCCAATTHGGINIIAGALDISDRKYGDDRIESMLLDVEHPEDVKSLDLSGNMLTRVPACLSRFSNLLALDLSANWLKVLGNGCFRGLKSLQLLDISKNRLVKLRTGYFDGVEGLQILSVSSNRLKFIQDKCFDSLKDLCSLDLSSNLLTKVFGVLEGLPKLQDLNLENNPTLSSVDARALDKRFRKAVKLDYNVLLEPCYDQPMRFQFSEVLRIILLPSLLGIAAALVPVILFLRYGKT